MSLENYGTVWVCVNCLHHHANGECGDCHSDHGHDAEPLNKIKWPFSLAEGVGWEDHDEDCLTYTVNDLKARFPHMIWPDVPGDYECKCDYVAHSYTGCDGCGTYLHGERHIVTLFKEV